MSKKEWGPACWFLFHGLATKVKESEFENIKYGLWQQIVGICNNLPCHECKKHATELIEKVNTPIILSSKRNLELFLLDFHNVVNKRNDSKIMTIEEYDRQYRRANLIPIIQNFISKFITNARNSKLMTDAMHRQFLSANFINWINANINKFDL